MCASSPDFPSISFPAALIDRFAKRSKSGNKRNIQVSVDFHLFNSLLLSYNFQMLKECAMMYIFVFVSGCSRQWFWRPSSQLGLTLHYDKSHRSVPSREMGKKENKIHSPQKKLFFGKYLSLAIYRLLVTTIHKGMLSKTTYRIFFRQEGGGGVNPQFH